MPCREMTDNISAYLDGELTGSKLDAFRKHLESCPDCRAELAEQEKLWGLLGEVRVAEATGELTQRILGRTIRRRRLRTVGAVGRPLRWLVPLAAAASVLVAVTIFRMRMQPPEKLDAEAIAVIEKLDVLENLGVLEDFDLLQAAVENPALMDDSDVIGVALEENSS